jgi:hypothetical protein
VGGGRCVRDHEDVLGARREREWWGREGREVSRRNGRWRGRTGNVHGKAGRHETERKGRDSRRE